MYPSGEEFKKRRLERKLSLRSLGALVGTSHSYISQIEDGSAANVSEMVLDKLCEVLGFNDEDEVPVDLRIAHLKSDFLSGKSNVDDLLERGASCRERLTDVNSTHAGDLYLILAKIYRLKRVYSEAIECASLAQHIFSLTGDTLSWCSATYELSNIDYDCDNFAFAISRLQMAEKKIMEIPFGNEDFLAKIYVATAVAAAAVSDHALMKLYLDKGERWLHHVPEDRRDSYRAITSSLRGEHLLKIGAYHDALTEFTKACVFYESWEDFSTSLKMRHNVAEAYMMLGDLVNAKSLCNEVLGLMKQTDSSETSLAETNHLLAEIAYRSNDIDESLRLCSEIVKERAVEPSRRAKAFRTIARCHYLRGDIDYFNKMMTEAALLLRGNRAYLNLSVEIHDEVLIANHAPYRLA